MIRTSLLALLALGCATEPSGDYEAYDPNTVAMPTPEAAIAAADAQRDDRLPWLAGANDGHRVFAGLTTLTTGRVVAPGFEPGFASGDALCRQLGADHVCDEDEIRTADAQGDFVGMPADLTFFLLPAGSRDARTTDREHGASCRALTYPTADQAWTGWGGGPNSSSRSTEKGESINYHTPPVRDYDPACLEDVSVCARFVPTGFGCNVPRSLPCCY